MRFQYQITLGEEGKLEALEGVLHCPGDPTAHHHRIYPMPLWIAESHRLQGVDIPGRFLEPDALPPARGFEPEFVVRDLVAVRNGTVRGRVILTSPHAVKEIKLLADNGMPTEYEVSIVGVGDVIREHDIDVVQVGYQLEAIHLVKVQPAPRMEASR